MSKPRKAARVLRQSLMEAEDTLQTLYEQGRIPARICNEFHRMFRTMDRRLDAWVNREEGHSG